MRTVIGRPVRRDTTSPRYSSAGPRPRSSSIRGRNSCDSRRNCSSARTSSTFARSSPGRDLGSRSRARSSSARWTGREHLSGRSRAARARCGGSRSPELRPCVVTRGSPRGRRRWDISNGDRASSTNDSMAWRWSLASPVGPAATPPAWHGGSALPGRVRRCRMRALCVRARRQSGACARWRSRGEGASGGRTLAFERPRRRLHVPTL